MLYIAIIGLVRYKYLGFRDFGAGTSEQGLRSRDFGAGNREQGKNNVYLMSPRNARTGTNKVRSLSLDKVSV